MSMFSKYSLEARVFPTIIGLIPFYILQYFFMNNLIHNKFFELKVVGNISISLIVIYFASEFFIRLPGKLVEDKLFNKKLNFPTTEFLLFNNVEYSTHFKNNIREKLKVDFNVILLSEEEETKNENEARMRIKESIGFIISKVKKGHLVLRQNISYGFFRNLWSASLIGIVFSGLLIGLSFQGNPTLFYVGLGLFLAYGLYLIFGKHVIKYFGDNYARKLIEEYSSGNY